MGIQGLFHYVDTYLECVDKHKLKKCNVIIDGNNLAHYLHAECTGINVAFGGDFDKYANYVRKFFEGLQTCGVNAIVVLDGGQPLLGKKLKTAVERAEAQILRCLSVDPESQFSEKVFPPICRQVFVTTLHNMGILVLQSDFEADDDIGALARKLNCSVISEDSDFFMANVGFLRLSSLSYKTISKKKFIACQRFNVEEFCRLTSVNRSHLALLGSLMGNDFLSKDDLQNFHSRVATEMNYHRRNVGLGRGLTIKYVMEWMAKRSDMTINEIVHEVVGRNQKLKRKIFESMQGYSLERSNLLDCIPYIVHTKENAKKGEKLPEEPRGNKEYVLVTTSENLERSSSLGTSLVLQNGESPPQWFVKAYRESRIPREVADILTNGYFISPAQVESFKKPSSYLVVEPIVRIVYTFLWKGCKSNEEKKALQTKVDSLSDELSSLSLKAEHNVNDSDSNSRANKNSVSKKTNKARSCKSSKSGNDKQDLSWYIRKHDSVWCKKVKFLEGKLADEMPSLEDIELMSCSERKSTFYWMLQMEHVSKEDDYPVNVELIFNIVIYWFRNTKMNLSACHALTVLVCFFMYCIIDMKIGRLRSWKDFDNIDSYKEKVAELLEDSSYTQPDMNERDLMGKITHEECLVASSVLFRYHHLDQNMNQKRYRKDIVHSFSEYQACAYFFQLLNSLLCMPFPFLSIEFLWGGTFGYNLFIELSGSSNRVKNIKEILGEGTCLARLFCLIYRKLDSILNFAKPPVNKTDRFNSRRFADDRERMEERRRIKVQSDLKKEKVKVKTEIDYEPGDNRFTALDSDSE